MSGYFMDSGDELAFAKIGMHGFPGSGKSYTASEIAIGIAKEFGGGRPVAFFDTEKGSGWLRRKYRAAGIDLKVRRERSFKALMEFTRQAEKEKCSVAIVDSVTHPWAELIDAAQKRFKTHKLKFHHWAPIKSDWAQFSDWFLNVDMHVLICGRAGWEYQMEKAEGEDEGYELRKTGTKMRAEAQFGFEPSLVLEMEGIKRSVLTGKLEDKEMIHRCIVLKDRSESMEGVEIDNPRFENFRPFFQALTGSTTEAHVDTRQTSEDLFDDPDRSRVRYAKERDIILENLKNVFVEHDLAGQSAKEKKRRLELLKQHFQTHAWSQIETLDIAFLADGLKSLREELRGEAQPEQPGTAAGDEAM